MKATRLAVTLVMLALLASGDLMTASWAAPHPSPPIATRRYQEGQRQGSQRADWGRAYRGIVVADRYSGIYYHPSDSRIPKDKRTRIHVTSVAAAQAAGFHPVVP